MIFSLENLLLLGTILFCISIAGLVLHRKNIINLLMCIELMLLSISMNFVAFSYFLDNIHGQIFVFFILTVAAAESAIGLAIMLVFFQHKGSIRIDDLSQMKG